MACNRQYKMKVAGQMFKHLGLQMYSGAVPAIAELISNAYDAMARNVWITIPISFTPGAKIIVKDDGHGMNYEECTGNYLFLGRDRRVHSQWSEEYNDLPLRKVQGRKGIGKLASFGVANKIEIRTVRHREIAHFSIDYEKLTKSTEFASQNGYECETLSDDGSRTEETNGTEVILSQLKLSRTISLDQFKKSIARRLLILDENFNVHVNSTTITRQEIPFQFRFPEKPGIWQESELSNGQQIEWWAGFCSNTIPEEENRGFVVYVRGKLAQTPWLFDISGGVWGQHGMQYLTGEIRADFLDEDVDLVATDRGSVRWEDPIAVPLKEWGAKKIKELLGSWTNKRRSEKKRSPIVTSYLEHAKKLPAKDCRLFESLVDRICSIPQLDKEQDGKDLTDELVTIIYNALTNKNFLDAIKQLATASPKDIERFSEILSDWDIIELVNIAHVVSGRVTIIRKFRDLIQQEAPEIPTMHNYIRDHPWLIDPRWDTLTHEKTLDKLLTDEFNASKSGEAEGRLRIDFFCIGDRVNTVYIVEIKRPGKSIGKAEFDKLEAYVLFLREQLQKKANAENKREVVRGLLIADKIKNKDASLADTRQRSGVFEIRSWSSVLTSTETLHEEFLSTVKERAPSDDPRIQNLEKHGLELQEKFDQSNA